MSSGNSHKEPCFPNSSNIASVQPNSNKILNEYVGILKVDDKKGETKDSSATKDCNLEVLGMKLQENNRNVASQEKEEAEDIVRGLEQGTNSNKKSKSQQKGSLSSLQSDHSVETFSAISQQWGFDENRNIIIRKLNPLKTTVQQNNSSFIKSFTIQKENENETTIVYSEKNSTHALLSPSTTDSSKTENKENKNLKQIGPAQLKPSEHRKRSDEEDQTQDTNRNPKSKDRKALFPIERSKKQKGEESTKRKRKCCGCCDITSIICYVVFIIGGSLLAALLFFECVPLRFKFRTNINFYLKIVELQWELQLQWIAYAYIIFVLVLTLLYAMLIICRTSKHCCRYFAIPLVVLHILIGGVVAVCMYHIKENYAMSFVAENRNWNTGKESLELYCCGRCLTYTLVMICLGVLPFVMFMLEYRENRDEIKPKRKCPEDFDQEENTDQKSSHTTSKVSFALGGSEKNYGKSFIKRGSFTSEYKMERHSLRSATVHPYPRSSRHPFIKRHNNFEEIGERNSTRKAALASLRVSIRPPLQQQPYNFGNEKFEKESRDWNLRQHQPKQYFKYDGHRRSKDGEHGSCSESQRRGSSFSKGSKPVADKTLHVALASFTI